MVRKIIKINEEKCNGCGLCVNACQEGAIGLVDGKAKLLRDDYCDGLGNCLPVCPTDAISFEEREAAAFDEEAVAANMKKAAHGCPGTQEKTFERDPKSIENQGQNLPCGCPSTHEKNFERREKPTTNQPQNQPLNQPQVNLESRLNQWPVQIKLVSPNMSAFHNANILVAADCTAYAYGNFHNQFMKNKVTLIGCPKLDEVDYADKLTAILKNNEVKSITVVRMEVPCCGGIVNAVKDALLRSGKMIPWQVITISTDGQIIE